MTLVTQKRIARALRVQGATVNTYLRPACRIKQIPYFELCEFQEMLQAIARDFPPGCGPSAVALLRKADRLVTAGEAIMHLDMARDTFDRLHGRRRMPYLQFRRQRMYLLSTLKERAETWAEIAKGLTWEQVEKVAGCDRESLRRAGLTMAYAAGSGRKVPLDTMLAFLQRRLLPSWVDPEAWLNERLHDPNPLLTVAQARHIISCHKTDFVRSLRQGEYDFIHSPGGKIFVPGRTVIEMIETMPVITDLEISWLFDVLISRVESWRRSGALRCPIHTWAGAAHPFRRPCLIVIMRVQASPGVHAGRWFSRRFGSKTPLMRVDQAASKTGISPEELTALLATGVIQGMRTLSGDWTFSHDALTKYVKTRAT